MLLPGTLGKLSFRDEKWRFSDFTVIYLEKSKVFWYFSSILVSLTSFGEKSPIIDKNSKNSKTYDTLRHLRHLRQNLRHTTTFTTIKINKARLKATKVAKTRKNRQNRWKTGIVFKFLEKIPKTQKNVIFHHEMTIFQVFLMFTQHIFSTKSSRTITTVGWHLRK